MSESKKQAKRFLYNRYSRQDLQKRLDAEDFSRRTVSFYRYVIIEDVEAMRDRLYAMWDDMQCLGRIYIAREGINAQMNVPEHYWEQFVQSLYAIDEFSNVPFKIAVEDDGKSFLKLTVKIRKQIVADGLEESEYDVTNVGKHLSAKEWNELMEAGDAIVVDMRNYYETEIGHFDGAVLPEAETFREELPEVLDKLKGQEEKPVLLYCTGGIRCEKTSAYLKHHGFENVNQLHGGIIDYARQIKEHDLPNKFKGKNFVFDDRLGESISEEVISRCHQCGKPSDHHTNCLNEACNILFIQCDECAEKFEHTCSDECQEIIHLPEEDQEVIRKKWAAEGRTGKRYMKIRTDA